MAELIGCLVRLRPHLPERVWLALRNALWRRYWQRQEREEEKALGKQELPIAGSERAVLTEALADEYPFHAVLEVGCAYGQNFYSLAALFPKARFFGVDSDAARILQGRALFEREGFLNVSLDLAEGADLSRFGAASFDFAVACACLLCVEPEQVRAVLSEMLRVSRRGIMLLEQHSDAPAEERSRSDGSGYWIHNYRELLEKAGAEEITVTRVPNPRWQIESWRECACLITARGRSAAAAQDLL